MIVITAKKNKEKKKEIDRFSEETSYSTFGACPNHPEIVFESLEPRMFSFNSPFGACPKCHGLGEITKISEELLIPDKSKSIMDGGIKIYGKMELAWRAQQIAIVGKRYGFDIWKPISSLDKKQMTVLLYGDMEPQKEGSENRWKHVNRQGKFEGVIPQTMFVNFSTWINNQALHSF